MFFDMHGWRYTCTKIFSLTDKTHCTPFYAKNYFLVSSFNFVDFTFYYLWANQTFNLYIKRHKCDKKISQPHQTSRVDSFCMPLLTPWIVHTIRACNKDIRIVPQIRTNCGYGSSTGGDRGVHSLLNFAYTCVWDLFIGGLFTLQKGLQGDGILHVKSLKILYVMVLCM